VAFHPSEKNDIHELYFMCHDLQGMMESLSKKKVKCGAPKKERCGNVTEIASPAAAGSACLL
jgi:hypothetical protein